MIRTSFAVRWGRLVCLGRNPLVRSSDRAERRVLVVALLVVLLALPLAWLAGSRTYQHESLRAQTEQATRHPATAVLLADGPPDTTTAQTASAGGSDLVLATWTRADGTTRTGTVAADAGTSAGERVSIWLDGQDNPVAPPMRADLAIWNGAGLGIFVWLGVIGLCTLVWFLIHLRLNKARYAQWERAWERELRGSS
ncbi:MAG TPA: hypothetical protein VFG87_16710 [Amycolatopsis sp.]|nr:hypothetical protein [Amycolatopsis sp.]